MNITIIIGNGFDKNLGLNTSYKDFYKNYYIKQKTDNPIIEKMREEIRNYSNGNEKGKEIENWGDAEKEFGIFSNKCETSKQYVDCYENLHSELIKYLNTIVINGKEEFAVQLFNSIENISKKFRINQQDVIKIYFINLNYTNIIEKEIDKLKEFCKNNNSIQIVDSIKLHGDLYNEPIFGVADIGQVINKKIRDNLTTSFVKQIVKINCDELLVKNKNYVRARTVIDNSNGIYSFGWSFGDTDNILLRYIAQSVRKNRKFIFYSHNFVLRNLERKSYEEDLFNNFHNDFLKEKLKHFGGNNIEMGYINNNIISECHSPFDNLTNFYKV